MQLPIPDDWDGQSWVCVRVYWPKSTLWLAILNGLVYNPTMGRFWDARNGVITDAQSVGREIWDRSFPFVTCSGEAIPPTIEQILYAGDCGGDSECEQECDDMGCGGIPRDVLRWQNGVLQYQNCGIWYDVSGIAPTGDIAPPEGDIADPPETVVPSTACAMAIIMAEKVYDIVAAALQYADEPQVWTFKESVEATVGVDLSYTECINMWFFSQPIVIAGLVAECLNPNVTQALKCQYSALIPEVNTGIDEATYNKLCDVTHSTASGVLGGDSAYVGIGRTMIDLWSSACKSIGPGDAQKLTYYAQPSQSDDCSCPGAELEATDPTGRAGWYLSAVETTRVVAPGGFDYAQAVFMHNLPHGAYGVAWQVVYVSGDPVERVKRVNDTTPQAGFDVWMFGSNSDDDGTDNWYVQCGSAAWSNIGDVLPNMVLRQNFLYSDTLNAPVVDALSEIVLAKIGVNATGNPAASTVDVNVRWLYNALDNSH